VIKNHQFLLVQDVSYTTPDRNVVELAHSAIANSSQSDLILVSGGDGTVSAIASALIGTSKILGRMALRKAISYAA
jgi:diacylglycerol kinase family enzyme